GIDHAHAGFQRVQDKQRGGISVHRHTEPQTQEGGNGHQNSYKGIHKESLHKDRTVYRGIDRKPLPVSQGEIFVTLIKSYPAISARSAVLSQRHCPGSKSGGSTRPPI
ncbi:MAG: hypothetical protein RL081_426, partial [Pseudomonadota bacterium]